MLVRNSLLQTLSVTFNVIPAAMALATITAVLVFHTPVFEVLSWPIARLLEFFAFPEAAAVALATPLSPSTWVHSPPAISLWVWAIST